MAKPESEIMQQKAAMLKKYCRLAAGEKEH